MCIRDSVGSNDPAEMYQYLGGVKNSKRSEELDAAFKQDKSNFRIAIVVDMWITGFDVPSLTYMYNDKPLQTHLLIQTISRVNRKYPGKEYGMIVDYIGIRDNMREALKMYGGNCSIAPTADDVQQATDAFRQELMILKDLFSGYDLDVYKRQELEFSTVIQEIGAFLLPVWQKIVTEEPMTGTWNAQAASWETSEE